MTAIDHPPGSPVFDALLKLLEECGYNFRTNTLGIIIDVEWHHNGIDPIRWKKTHTPGALIGSPFSYESLIRLATNAGIELED